MRFQTVLTFALLLTACQGPLPDPGHEPTALDEGKADRASATTYIDAEVFWQTAEDQDRWWAVERTLRQNFDSVCGDTFCGGDYANLEALSLRCAVSSEIGMIRSCLWVFAGSWEEINPSTGDITVNTKFFECRLPVSGRIADLALTLSAPGGQRAIDRPLDGGKSIYEGLVDCL